MRNATDSLEDAQAVRVPPEPGIRTLQRQEFGHSQAEGSNKQVEKADVLLASPRPDGAVGSVLAATFSAYTDERPIEAVHLSFIQGKGADGSKAKDWLVIRRAADFLFSRLPWLLTVVVTDTPTSDKSDAEQQHVGFAKFWTGARGQELSCFELSRDRWRESLGHGASLSPDDSLSRMFGKSPEDPPAIFLGTGSPSKRTQYEYLLRCHGFEAKRASHGLLLPEPQVEGHGLHDETALVSEPLKYAARWLAKEHLYPFLIEDTMLFIEHFNRNYDEAPLLPGPDTKRWWAALGYEGILEALEGSRRRRAKYGCQIGLHTDRRQYKFFRAEVHGRIAYEARVAVPANEAFPYTNPTFFHPIFIPDGSDLTLAEMDAAGFARFDYRRRCLAKASGTMKATALRGYRQGELPI